MKRRVFLVLATLLFIGVVVVALYRRREAGPAGCPDDLSRLIDQADKLVVRQEPWEGSEVLFESSDRRDLDAFKASLRVEHPEKYLHCMCDGTPAVFLYANGQQIGQITNHHGKLLRCSLWKSDARLVEVEVFLKWFDDRKISGPRKEHEAGQQRDQETKEQEQKWIDAMPAALKPHWQKVRQSSLDPDLTPLRNALADGVAMKSDRILALFAWYGSGRGPWSGYPAYESIAENMLLDYKTPELLTAIEGKELTARQTEGVARLFGGWMFSQLRPNDLEQLPAELKARLLQHSLTNADEDKQHRARRAFGAK
jgi:hypothetical protein